MPLDDMTADGEMSAAVLEKPAAPAPVAKPAAKAAPAVAPAAPIAKPAAAPAKVTTGTSFLDDDDDVGGDEPDPAAGETVVAKGVEGDLDGESKTPAAWPDDWRDRLAGGDDKMLGELKRYSSFDNWAKAQRVLRAKLSSGEFKKAESFDEGWDDTKKVAWRKEHGIPEKAADYKLPEVKGFEWSDGDRASMAPFLERMHARNAAPEVVQDALAHYASAVQEAKDRLVLNDREHKIALEDQLRTEWGPDYRGNVNLMKRALADSDVLPGGMTEGGAGAALAEARTADGRRLINVPAVAEFLAGLARSKYGEGGLIPPNETRDLNAREAELVKLMATDINRYYREKNAAGQTGEQELRAIRERKSGKPKKN